MFLERSYTFAQIFFSWYGNSRFFFFFLRCTFNFFFNQSGSVHSLQLIDQESESTYTSSLSLFKALWVEILLPFLLYSALHIPPTLFSSTLEGKQFDLNHELQNYDCEKEVSKWVLLFRILLSHWPLIKQAKVRWIAIRKETCWIVKSN